MSYSLSHQRTFWASLKLHHRCLGWGEGGNVSKRERMALWFWVRRFAATDKSIRDSSAPWMLEAFHIQKGTAGGGKEEQGLTLPCLILGELLNVEELIYVPIGSAFRFKLTLALMHHHWVTSGLPEVQHSYGITCSHLFCRPMKKPALEPVDKRFVEQSRILLGRKRGTNTQPLSHFHLMCWASAWLSAGGMRIVSWSYYSRS